MAELNFGLLNNDFTGQQEKAFNYAAQISALAAQRNAGRAYAQGDYTGASQALARNGDIAQGQKVAQYGAQRQAGSSYASGDYGGAASALAQGGDIQGAQAIEQRQSTLQNAQLERTAKGQQYIAQALPVLKQVAAAHAADPDGGTAARAAAFDHIAAEAQQLTGASPQQLAAFKDSWVSDPQGTLTRLEAQIPTEFKTAGDSLFAFKNGQQVGQYEGTKTVTAGPGQTVLQYGGSGGPIQPQGAGGAPVVPDANPGPQASNGPTEAQVQDYIAKNIPGAIITSGQRTPEHNAEVGGVPNSMHIPGQAVDFVMPKGMTFDQVKAMVAQTGLQPTELLNEGSHVHLAWGPKPGAQAPPAAGGARVLYQGKPPFRDPTPAEIAAHPGLSQINNATGEFHYAPASVIGQQAGNNVTLGEQNPNSKSILAQTGLSNPAYMVLTGHASQLPRDAASRTKAFKEAEMFANQNGVDVSTLQSQVKTYNDVLSKNIERVNQTRIMEQELQGTISNLKPIADAAKLGNLNIANVARLWSGQQTNDPVVQQYAQQLNQLRSELAGYNAATQGRGGSSITQQDYQEAEHVIKNGLSSRGADGLREAIEASTGKMGTILDNNVTSAQRHIWDLFGVGQNFDKAHGITPATAPRQGKSDPLGIRK